MEITDVTEFRIYVELARRKRHFIEGTQEVYDKYGTHSLIASEIEHRHKLQIQINKAKEELTELDDILDRLDDDSEYLYTSDNEGEPVGVIQQDITHEFTIIQVTNYHGLTQLLINMVD